MGVGKEYKVLELSNSSCSDLNYLVSKNEGASKIVFKISK